MVPGERLQAFRDGAQHLVADVVAVGVVDLLEMVEVEDHQPDRLVDPAELLEIFLQRIVEIAPVLHPGETVGQRGLFQRLRSGAERNSHGAQLALLPRVPPDHRVDEEDGEEHGDGEEQSGRQEQLADVADLRDALRLRERLGSGHEQRKGLVNEGASREENGNDNEQRRFRFVEAHFRPAGDTTAVMASTALRLVNSGQPERESDVKVRFICSAGRAV